MGIFGGKNRVKGESPVTTLIAEGCTIIGQLQLDNLLQIDGHVEGKINAKTQVKISKTGYVLGEITTGRLIINGYFEGTCHAEYIDILNNGVLTGEVYTENLSIESGGKFMGVTNPSEDSSERMLSHKEEQEEEAKLIGNSHSDIKRS